MPKYSEKSKENLSQCNEKLQMVFNKVVEYYDCTIIKGHRNQEEQHRAFLSGNSKLDWPHGKHNRTPSDACDAAPYPVNYSDIKGLHFFAGFVIAIALSMGVKLRWGGDWDGDFDLKDNKFNDLVHFETIDN